MKAIAVGSRSVRWSSFGVHLAKNPEFLYASGMASTPERTRVGRPCRNPVDQLCTQYWFGVTRVKSGLLSADALERRLQPELVRPREDGMLRPSKYCRYRGGSRVPSRIHGKSCPVDLAEEAFPGTALSFDSVIWPLLKGRQLALDEADDLLWAMSDAIRQVIFESRVVPGQPHRQIFNGCATSTILWRRLLPRGELLKR